MTKTLLIFISVSFLSGCLVTRSNLREATTPTENQVVRASAQVKYQELEEQLRLMNGRIEVLENSISILGAEKKGEEVQRDAEKRDLSERLQIYEEALKKLEIQYLSLAQRVEGLQSSAASGRSGAASAGSTQKTSWEVAEEEFKKKNWQQAIVGYQKYRDLNPKGRNYAEATFKIGTSFQELGMNSEARAFFLEVIEKFPKTKTAGSASERLKNIK